MPRLLETLVARFTKSCCAPDASNDPPPPIGAKFDHITLLE